jgi:phage protein U
MAYATLGDITFDRLYSPTALRITQAEKYAVIPLATGKPRIQRIGAELDTLDLSIRVNRQFCDVTSELEKIRAARAGALVLPFTTGEGEFLGNYIITQVNQARTDIAPNGVLIEVVLDISLLEYNNADEGDRVQADAQRRAFANDVRKVVPVLPVKAVSSNAALISAQSRWSAASVNVAARDAKKAAQGAETVSRLKRAKQQVEAARDKVQTVIDKLQQDAALAAKAPQMLAAAQTALNYIPEVLAAIVSGDAQGALSAINALGVLVANMVAKGVNIETDLLKRKA